MAAPEASGLAAEATREAHALRQELYATRRAAQDAQARAQAAAQALAAREAEAREAEARRQDAERAAQQLQRALAEVRRGPPGRLPSPLSPFPPPPTK